MVYFLYTLINFVSERSEESANQALGVDNYRKKFAQGGVAGSLIMSDQSPISHLTSFDHHIRYILKFYNLWYKGHAEY